MVVISSVHAHVRTVEDTAFIYKLTNNVITMYVGSFKFLIERMNKFIVNITS